MKLFLVAVAVAFVAVARADLTAVKKEAVQKVSSQVDQIKGLVALTKGELEKGSGIIKMIATHQREFAAGIFSELQFELAKTAKSATIMASLLNCTQKVFACIAESEKKYLEQSAEYYKGRFLASATAQEQAGEKKTKDLIKEWNEEHPKAVARHVVAQKEAIGDIEKAATEAAVGAVVKQFSQTTQKTADVVQKILPAINREHLHVLRVFNGLVFNQYNYAKDSVAGLSDAVEKCFSVKL